jgi:tetratricopeptide (TPR) repeat protein
MRALVLTACFIFISTVCQPVIAQVSRPGNYFQIYASQQAKNPGPGFSSSNTKDRQRAVAILRQILADSSQFEETYNKAINILYLKYRVAVLLWEHDQKLARRLFVEAFQEAGSKSYDQGPMEVSMRLREEILELLLPHDAGLAEELATSPAMYDGVPRMRALGKQAALLSRVATGLIDSPHQAATLIQQSYNGWFGYQQIEALRSLRERLPARADEIFQYAISLVERKPTNLSNKISILSPYLFPELERGELIRGRDEQAESEHAKSSVALVKSYLEFVFRAFMQQSIEAQLAENNEFGKSSFDARAMQALIPHFEKHLPEQAPVFRTRIDEIREQIKQTDRQDYLEREAELYRKHFSQSAPDLIAKAKQMEDQKERADLYGQAADILVSQGKFDEAIELLPHIAAGNGGSLTGGDIVFGLAASASLEKGEIEQAAKYLRNIKDPDSLTRGLIGIARSAITQQKTPQAKKHLEEARQTLKHVADQKTRAWLMVAIANAEAKLDSSRGFREMEATVELLNRIGWGEGNSSGMGPDGITLRMNTYDFSEGLILLARADFSRAISLAKRMRQKEASAFALLAVCRGILRRE